MANQLIHSITDALTSKVPAEVIIFIISMMPILELRGGLIAASILGVKWIYAFPICVIGNVLPLVFIILFIDQIFAFLKKTKLKKMIEHFEEKAGAKSEQITKYKEWGLFTFVAIPLPMTGGWTGALIASILRMKLKDSFLPITLGVITAGLIISAIAYFIPYCLR